MASLECYEKLRRDVKEILSEENNLVDGDEYLFQFVIEKSSNSKIFLDFVRALKEEGNSFYKEGKFDEALEKYGYAAVILVRYNFVTEEDKEKFSELAICLLLNLTACLGKKNEFGLVGQVCTIILEHRPSNVKALFRRAKAAKALGRNDLAYWDLILAIEVEPNNGELNKALEEVRNSYGNDELKSDNQGKAPIGLGLSLPPSKKKLGRTQGKDQTVVEDNLCNVNDFATDSEFNNKKEGEDVKVVSEASTITYSSSHAPMDTDSIDKEVENIQAEKPMDTCSSPNSSLSYTNVSHNSVNEESSHLEGPKYMFHSRRRRGSFLSITKTNYLLMTQGKELSFYNSKSGSFMQVRVVQKPKENSVIESVHEQKQEDKGDVDLVETPSQLNSCVTSDGVQVNYVDSSAPHSEEEVCSSNGMVPHFYFSAKHTVKTWRKRSKTRINSSSQSQGGSKRRRMRVNNSSSSLNANDVCGCRFETGKKRKHAHSPLLVLCNRPRKKPSPFLCSCSSNDDYLCYGCNNGYVGKFSVEDDSTYEVAYGQSNGY